MYVYIRLTGQNALTILWGLPATITIAVALQVSSPLLAGKLDTLSESKDSHAANRCYFNAAHPQHISSLMSTWF